MIIYTVKVQGNGDKHWYLDGKLHRSDGPAVEWADGSKFWYLDGKLHRSDGPAVEYANGDARFWYLDDKQLTQAQWKRAVNPKVASCVGKVVEVDGVKYRLIAA
jgi:hypothetical protein